MGKEGGKYGGSEKERQREGEGRKSIMIFASVQPSSTTHFRVPFPSPHLKAAGIFATQDHAKARDSNAAQGNTQDMEATSASL